MLHCTTVIMVYSRSFEIVKIFGSEERMRRIAVSISKGGVGKTTTAVNLAAGLAAKGKRVLMVDTDTQGQASAMLGVRPDVGLAEFVSGDATFEVAATVAREGLLILAGGRSLAALKRVISRQEYGGEKVLEEAMSKVDAPFDYVILDTAPGWDALTVNVLFYAREILAPVSTEVLTLDSLIEFTKSIEAIQKYNTDLKLNYVLPTFLDGRVKKSAEILTQLKKHFGRGVVLAPVRYNVRLSEAPGYGQTIYEYAPGSSGAEDYKALTERISKNGRA